MCECLVSLCHLVCIVTLLGSAAGAIHSIEDFTCKSFFHCLFASESGIVSHPAQTEGLSSLRTNLHWNLVCGIINTVTQLTDTPKRISIAVNKANYTHDMIKKTGVFNVSVLSNDAPFAMFQHYGFQSGRDVDKFAGVQGMARATNGVYYLPYCTNAFISARVTQTIEFETHTLFIADVTEARQLSDVPSMTYAYYFANVKPKPSKLKEQHGWVCKIDVD